MTDANHRHSDHPIDKLFLERWSPRAFTDEQMGEADLMTLFEAARWAPSSYNSQPWLNSTMLPPGKDTPVPSYSHSMDAGSAWASLALQATLLGWQAHGMVGFDKERAFAELGVPVGYRVEQMIAVGRPGDKTTLAEAMAAREHPSERIPLAQIVMEGKFKA